VTGIRFELVLEKNDQSVHCIYQIKYSDWMIFEYKHKTSIQTFYNEKNQFQGNENIWRTSAFYEKESSKSRFNSIQ